jgi:hypothetical protein
LHNKSEIHHEQNVLHRDNDYNEYEKQNESRCMDSNFRSTEIHHEMAIYLSSPSSSYQRREYFNFILLSVVIVAKTSTNPNNKYSSVGLTFFSLSIQLFHEMFDLII